GEGRRHHTPDRNTSAPRQAQGLEIIGWVFHWSHFRQQRPG
ncbi:transcriptional regulator, partial [Arthrobacter frigidicola]